MCRPGRYPATPSPERPRSPCWARREGAVPQGPHPQVSLPGPSGDGGGGRGSETGRSAPRQRPGMEWEVRPRQVAWGSRLRGNGAGGPGSRGAAWGARLCGESLLSRRVVGARAQCVGARV